jgi:hypothetical protein
MKKPAVSRLAFRCGSASNGYSMESLLKKDRVVVADEYEARFAVGTLCRLESFVHQDADGGGSLQESPAEF